MKKSEAEEQKVLFEWADNQKCKYPELALMFHIPNGGSRHIVEAKNLKLQGVKAGVPDICLPVPRNYLIPVDKDVSPELTQEYYTVIFHGLYIELKAIGGRLSEAQKDWLEALHMQGYAVAVCYGFDEAKEAIMDYITNKPRKWGVDYAKRTRK